MYKDDLRLYLRLLAYLKPHKFRMTAAILAMLGVSGLTALLAYLVKPVLDDVFFGRVVPDVDREVLPALRAQRSDLRDRVSFGSTRNPNTRASMPVVKGLRGTD